MEDPPSSAILEDTQLSSLPSECMAEVSSLVACFHQPPVSDATVGRIAVLLRRLTACAGSVSPAPLVAPVCDLLRLYLALHVDGKVAARDGREWPLQMDVSGQQARPVTRPERRQHAAYSDEPILEWHAVLVAEELRPPPPPPPPPAESRGAAALRAKYGLRSPAATVESGDCPRTGARNTRQSCSPVSRPRRLAAAGGAVRGRRLAQAVRLAPGAGLWCSYTDDWEAQVCAISRQAEQLLADASPRVTEELIYGQLLIYQNCALADMPRYLRCVSVTRRPAEGPLTTVWLCDLGGALLVRRASLLSMPGQAPGMQLYHRPPLLVLLTGMRVQMAVPAQLVSDCLSLLTALTHGADAELGRQLASSQLAWLVAEVAGAGRDSASAVRLLVRLSQTTAGAAVVRSTAVAGPLVGVVCRELASPLADVDLLAAVVQLLTAAVGAGHQDPVRRLLLNSYVIDDVLRRDLDSCLHRKAQALMTRLLEDNLSPPSVSTPRRATSQRNGPRTASPQRHQSAAGETPGRHTTAAPVRLWPSQARPRTGTQQRHRPADVQTHCICCRKRAAADVSLTLEGRTGWESAEEELPPPRGGRGVALRDDDLESDGDEPARDHVTAPPHSPVLGDGRWYRYGQQARLRSGPQLQLEWKVSRPQGIGKLRTAQLLSGLMNSCGGGAVYYGINRQRRAVGITTSREERDRLRIGLDKLLTSGLLPPLPPDCCRLHFVPVLESGHTAGQYDPAQHTLFVVSLLCKPAPREVFIVRETGVAYERRPDADGSHAEFPIPLHRLRCLVADREAALVRRRQMALQSAAACLRRLSDGAAATTCQQCGQLRQPEPQPQHEHQLEARSDSDSSGLGVG